MSYTIQASIQSIAPFIRSLLTCDTFTDHVTTVQCACLLADGTVR